MLGIFVFLMVSVIFLFFLVGWLVMMVMVLIGLWWMNVKMRLSIEGWLFFWMMSMWCELVSVWSLGDRFLLLSLFGGMVCSMLFWIVLVMVVLWGLGERSVCFWIVGWLGGCCWGVVMLWFGVKWLLKGGGEFVFCWILCY